MGHPRQLGGETAGAHEGISVARRITLGLPLRAMPYLKLGIARMTGYVSDAAKGWQQSHHSTAFTAQIQCVLGAKHHPHFVPACGTRIRFGACWGSGCRTVVADHEG
jgi:hypothetical protein